ncbi:DeoR family transcriptional regulator [Serratia ureilytica]
MLMLRTFFESYRGWHVQYNIVSRETLLAAKQHPDQYRDLVVRVAGYSAFFTALSPEAQDDIIARTEHTLNLDFSGRTWRPHHQADMNLRQQTILQLVNDRRRISVNELARASGVSEVTIRQDLNLLEKRSYLKRVHGSAVALESDDVDARMMSISPSNNGWRNMPPRRSTTARRSSSRAAAPMPCWRATSPSASALR